MKPREKSKVKSVFVTVGSTGFSKLIDSILSYEILDSMIDLGIKQLTIQYGNSEFDDNLFHHYKEKFQDKLQITAYRYKPSIELDIEQADLVIGHAGAGTCLEVLRANKLLLLVINDSLMDNHQNELAEELESGNYLIKATCSDLSNYLKQICHPQIKLERFAPNDGGRFKTIFDEALKKVICDGSKDE